MTDGIMERLAAGPVLGDGGYLLELEKRGYVQAGPFTPEVVIEHPEALEQLHREFLLAGAWAVQVGTALLIDPTAHVEIARGIVAYLREKGIASPNDLRGRLRVGAGGNGSG